MQDRTEETPNQTEHMRFWLTKLMNQLKTAIKTYSWIKNYKLYVKKKGYRLQVFSMMALYLNVTMESQTRRNI